MKEWLANLSPRDRAALGAGVVLVAVLLVWALVWDPFARDYERLGQVVSEQRELVAWMTGAVAEVHQLRAGGGATSARRGDGSLLALVDRTTKARGLASAVKRVQPEGADKVRVWFEAAEFDVLITWLGQLSTGEGIRVTSANIERLPTPGRVNARLALTTPEAG